MPDPILPLDPLGPPGKLVRRACDRYGRDRVVDWCVRLVTGGEDQPDDPDISWLGGHHGWDAEWTRVWALRAFTHLDDPAAGAAVEHGLRDPSWRVREMALNVVGRWRLAGFGGELDRLVDDEEARVRNAATRARAQLAG